MNSFGYFYFGVQWSSKIFFPKTIMQFSENELFHFLPYPILEALSFIVNSIGNAIHQIMFATTKHCCAYTEPLFQF